MPQSSEPTCPHMPATFLKAGYHLIWCPICDKDWAERPSPQASISKDSTTSLSAPQSSEAKEPLETKAADSKANPLQALLAKNKAEQKAKACKCDHNESICTGDYASCPRCKEECVPF
jgi:hypothetical protein